jgi:hypothetical protein
LAYLLIKPFAFTDQDLESVLVHKARVRKVQCDLYTLALEYIPGYLEKPYVKA